MTNRQAMFVHTENVRHLEERLRKETDSKKIEMIKKLLEEEKARILPGDDQNSNMGDSNG